jgi:predicted glutamine amidotransferase
VKSIATAGASPPRRADDGASTKAHDPPRATRDFASARCPRAARSSSRTCESAPSARSERRTRGRWVFAHNGTVQDRAWISANTSPERAAEIRGETDSEAFFAFVLTRLDEAAVTCASPETDDVLARTLAECRAREGFGSFNFLLSDGASVYAHRFGRSLYVLERTGDRRSPSVFIASEAMTDEAWREVESGTLLCVSVAGERRWTVP